MTRNVLTVERADAAARASGSDMAARPWNDGRIAAVIPASVVSGPGRQLAGLAVALREHGWRMRLYLLWRNGQPRPPYAEFLDRQGVEYELIADGGPLDYGVVRRLRAAFDLWLPHIVQTHGYKATAAVAILRPTASWKWVGCYHGATAESRRAAFYHWLDRRLLRRADQVVVMSRQQAALISGAVRVDVVNNAVIPLASASDHDTSRVAAAVEDLPRPLLACIGRLSHEKGVDLLIEAVSILRDRGFSCGLAIAGTGPEKEALARMVEDAQLGARVRFMGSVSAVGKLYDLADVVVIPSRSEGLPNVLLEALNADRPVVATAVGAVPDVIADSRAGIVVQPERPAELADGIAAALQTADSPACRSARAAITRAYSIQRRAESHDRLYRTLL